MTSNGYSEKNATTLYLNLFQHRDPMNRCTLKNKNPLAAIENCVVRQRAISKDKHGWLQLLLTLINSYAIPDCMAYN